MSDSENEERVKNQLPEKYKDHSLAADHDYEDFEEASGIWNPCSGGNFKVVRPHTQYYIPAYMMTIARHNPLPRLEEVTVDSGDFLLISPPKTGTHFVYEIMNMLAHGSAQYSSKAKEKFWVETVSYDNIIAESPSPRILNTHLQLSQMPPNFLRKDTKIVMTMRNMKDTFVSMYHMWKNFKCADQNIPDDQKWQKSFPYLLHCKGGVFGNFFEMYADIWANRDNPNCLLVFFEDLKKEPEREVGRIAKHMGVSCTPDLIKSVAEATKFKNMKSGKATSENPLREAMGNVTVYRKGEVGDWKNHFTVAQNEEFDAFFAEWNKTRQIPMQLV